ncbi:MAG: hypothetical protein AB7K64_15935 [Variibacter sp.]
MKTIANDPKAENPAALGAVEDDVRALVQREIAPMLKTVTAPSAHHASPPLAPAAQNAAGSTTIDAIDRLIGELQETRDYLKTEGDRIARATARYEKVSQNAAASVEIISDTISQWRKTGFS